MIIFSGINRGERASARIIPLAFLVLFLCFSIGKTALAAPAASPCDPDYYDSLKSRAWLEAQREITQNQNLIFKPDSVLEYTCFDQYMDILALQASYMFSETTRWGPIPGITSTSMDAALQNLVGDALMRYTAANFSHPFLGGHSGNDYIPNPVSGSPSYTCAKMYEVWNEAKCRDFISDPANDGFYTFENYRDSPDKRVLPEPCTNPDLKTRWTNEIGLATINATTPWEEDSTVTYFDLLDPAKCTTALKIETGITVIRSKEDPSTYREKVCIAPGCHYVPTGANAGSCQP